jgi:CheY-like chemotaxis protein
MMEQKNKKILLVDDEPDVLKIVKLRLETAGYTVATAVNGQEALDCIFRECPNLVVSDVLMPIMDGFTLYKKLKSNPTTADIPVLILTARGHMEDSFRVMGADDFLAKPFEHQELLAKVESLFTRSTIKQESNKKVLVAGSDKAVVENMAFQLKKIGCLPEMAKDGPEIITKIVQCSPDILIMEIPMLSMAADEVIKILRQMNQFMSRPILLYNFYKIEELGSSDVRSKAIAIEDAKAACLQAGATENIGRFNEFSFLETIAKYLKSEPASKK